MEDKDINKMIDETLSSIDNIKRINAGEVKYENVLSEIKSRRIKTFEYPKSFIYKAAAVFIMLLTLNVYTWAHISIQKEKYSKEIYHYTVKSIADSYFKLE